MASSQKRDPSFRRFTNSPFQIPPPGQGVVQLPEGGRFGVLAGDNLDIFSQQLIGIVSGNLPARLVGIDDLPLPVGEDKHFAGLLDSLPQQVDGGFQLLGFGEVLGHNDVGVLPGRKALDADPQNFDVQFRFILFQNGVALPLCF